MSSSDVPPNLRASLSKFVRPCDEKGAMAGIFLGGDLAAGGGLTMACLMVIGLASVELGGAILQEDDTRSYALVAVCKNRPASLWAGWAGPAAIEYDQFDLICSQLVSGLPSLGCTKGTPIRVGITVDWA